MPKWRWIGLVVGAGLALAACSDGGATTDGGRDLVYVGTSTSFAALDPETGKTEFAVGNAVAAPDWSRVVRTSVARGDTRLFVLDAETGQEAWSQDVDGRLEVRAVSTTGHSVVLGEPRVVGHDPYLPAGRANTTLTVVRPDRDQAQTIRLDGNIEPEAFTVDEQSLFVLQYRPPLAPTTYQVRRLDLATGDLHDVYSVDGHLQNRMRGTARTQAMSPDGTRLYTLYTLRDGGETSAFVHVLSLDEEWAHCVFLPEEFENAPEASTALAVGPDGNRLYATETATGTLAEIDTEELAVERTSVVQLDGPSASMAVGDDGRVYLGSGRVVTVVDGDELETIDSWPNGDVVSGIQVSADGSRVFAGTGQRHVAVLNAADGTRLSLLTVPDDTVIKHVGRSSPPLPPSRSTAQCAC
jgi:outer membrane protein assembly factor BamB